MSEPSKAVAVPEPTRITSIRFVDSVSILGETLGVVAPDVAITPARLEADGRAVPISQGQVPGGFLLTQRSIDRRTNTPRLERVYVPMGNVRCVIYGV